jgi:branched-chain amino acid transport system substrate-binding protein
MRTRSAIAGLLLAICAAGLTACGDDDETEGAGTSVSTTEAAGKIDPSKPPATFALITFKLPGLNYVDPFKAGAEAAAQKINDAGGIGGREVVIETCNSMLQPAAATACANRTLERDPIAMFGCEIGWSASGLQIYAKAEVPSFNCVNTDEDVTNPWSLGINPGGFGYQRGFAHWACDNPDIDKAVMLSYDNPLERRDLPRSVNPVFDGCGKEVDFVWFKTGGADVSVQVNQILDAEPDFVYSPLGGATAVVVFKGLQQAGITGTKLGGPDAGLDYETVIEPAGEILEGAYTFSGFDAWGDTDNPDVAEYLEAMESFEEHARNPGAQWGYAAVMWFDTVAREVGPKGFDSASLAEFTRTQTDIPMPLSRELINPGPKGAPQVKQPYVQVAQLKDGEPLPVTENTEEGWVLAYDE